MDGSTGSWIPGQEETAENGGWFYAIGSAAPWGDPPGIPGAAVVETQTELWTMCPPPTLDSADGYEPDPGWTLLFRQTAGNYQAADAWRHMGSQDGGERQTMRECEGSTVT